MVLVFIGLVLNLKSNVVIYIGIVIFGKIIYIGYRQSNGGVLYWFMTLRKWINKVMQMLGWKKSESWARKQIRGIAELRGKLILM